MIALGRLQRVSTKSFVVLGLAVAALLVGFTVVGVGAGAKTIEVHKMASADFDTFPNGPVFIAIVGTDDRPGVGGARADAIHVIGVNPQQGKATMLDIPRDTYIDIPGVGQRKINESNTAGGAELVGKTLSQLTGANVQYVITTNFAGFTTLIDDSGGLDMHVPRPIHDPRYSGADFNVGNYHLTGDAALAIARARHNLPRGDITRTHDQGLLLLAALTQVKGEHPDPGTTMQLVAQLMRHLRGSSGVGLSDLYGLGRLALALDPANITHVVMPATTGSAGGASVVFPTSDAGPLFKDFADDAILETTADLGGNGG